MQAEQVNQLVQSVDNLVVTKLNDAVQESFSNTGKNKVNYYKTACIALSIVLIMALFGYAIVGSVNNAVKTNNNTILAAIGSVDANVAAGNADIIAGLDEVNTSVKEVVKTQVETTDKVVKLQSSVDLMASKLKATVAKHPNAGLKKVDAFMHCSRMIINIKLSPEATAANLIACEGLLK